jgi:hypothetical protein
VIADGPGVHLYAVLVNSLCDHSSQIITETLSLTENFCVMMEQFIITTADVGFDYHKFCGFSFVADTRETLDD